MNARDLVTSALKTIGVISTGETPSSSEAEDGLSVLNMMIESWSNDNLALFNLKREVFELLPGKGDYTIGIGAEFNTSRPMEVQAAAYGNLIKTPIYEDVEVPGVPTEEDPDPEPTIEQQLVGYSLASDFEIPMEILPFQKWAGTTLKQTTSTIPTELYVHGDAPFEKLTLWPVPSVECGLVLYSRKQLTGFEDLDTEADFPPGYSEAIKYNLAMRLAPEYGREPSAYITKFAIDSLAKIKRKNSGVNIMKSDVLGLSNGKRFNILAGDIR